MPGRHSLAVNHSRPALVRSVNRYGRTNASDLIIWAANGAAGISQHQPFVDDNIPAAFTATGLFLAVSGFRLVATPVDAARIMLAPADGELSETELAERLRSHIQRRSDVSGRFRRTENSAAAGLQEMAY